MNIHPKCSQYLLIHTDTMAVTGNAAWSWGWFCCYYHFMFSSLVTKYFVQFRCQYKKNFLHSHSFTTFFPFIRDPSIISYLTMYSKKKRVNTIQQWNRRESVFFLRNLFFTLFMCMFPAYSDKLLSSVLFSLCMDFMIWFHIFFCVYMSVYRNHSPIFVVAVVLIIIANLFACLLTPLVWLDFLMHIQISSTILLLYGSTKTYSAGYLKIDGRFFTPSVYIPSSDKHFLLGLITLIFIKFERLETLKQLWT